MEDGILVKAQKASRTKGGPPDEAIFGVVQRRRANVVNDLMVLEIQPGKFEYLFPPNNARWRISYPARIAAASASPTSLCQLDETAPDCRD
jgi:hypothetical protein